MLSKLLKQSVAESREICREWGDMRQLGLVSVASMRRMATRLDTKVNGVRGDVELSIKPEAMGSRVHKWSMGGVSRCR